MTRLIPYLIVTTLCGVSISHAQDPPDSGMEAMQAVSFLVGRWEGDGWMQRGPGERHTFTSTEMVESRLDGRVLIVEGLHHAAGGEVVHHALAVISHDAPRGGYRFRSHLAGGEDGDHEAELVDGAFIWGFETERGRVRFTIRVEDDEWHELGHFSADGENWHPFFQMDLKRVDS